MLLQVTIAPMEILYVLMEIFHKSLYCEFKK